LAIRLLALTGCRVGEVLALQWEHIDLTVGTAWLPDGKAGARSVSLGAQASALLAGAEQSGEWVVIGPQPDRPLSYSALDSAWRRIRTRAGLKNARLHDFRHTVGTYAGQTGANAFMVRDKLGHKTLAMTSRYVERDTDPMRELSDNIESRITSAMKGGKAQVLPLRGY